MCHRYPKSLYFDEITPRKGTMPKQRYDNTKTTTVRDSVIRDKMYGSIQSPAPSKPHTSGTCEHQENDVIYPSFENESSNNVWDSLFDEFRTAGSAIRPADLVELANIHVTPEYVSPVFEYIHILILGKKPEQKKVYSSKCDARKILLRESSSLLQYMQQVCVEFVFAVVWINIVCRLIHEIFHWTTLRKPQNSSKGV